MLTFQFVPDVGANGVVDFVEGSVVAHIKLDLIDDSMIGEIDEKDFRRRVPEHELGVFRRAHECLLHTTGGDLVVNADTNAHRMHL